MQLRLVGLVLSGLLASACANDDASPGVAGPSLDLSISALTLANIGDAVWDIQVVNGDTPGQTVFETRITSARFGDSAGSATYIGTCDAQAGATSDASGPYADNTVNVWLVGMYATGSTVDPGAGFAGGALNGATTPVDFQNPGKLSRVIKCRENQDNLVEFNVTLMRPAKQGFFDIALNFDDMFCSAKFDCAYNVDGVCDTDTNQCTTGTLVDTLTQCDDDSDCRANTDINLLHASEGRDRTVVMGFACAAGIEADANTELWMNDIEIDCSGAAFDAAWPDATRLDPAGGPDGNVCDTAGSGVDGSGRSGCGALTEGSYGDHLFQAAVYRGDELLGLGGGSKVCNQGAASVIWKPCTTDQDCSGTGVTAGACGYHNTCLAGDTSRVGTLCTDNADCSTGGVCGAPRYCLTYGYTTLLCSSDTDCQKGSPQYWEPCGPPAFSNSTLSKRYWDVAFGVTEASRTAGCKLRTRATADDTSDNADGGVGSVARTVPDDFIYPFIAWNVDLDTCTQEPLGFDGQTDVQVEYTKIDADTDPVVFEHTYP